MDTRPSSHFEESARLDHLINELSSVLPRTTGDAVTAVIERTIRRIVEGIDIDRGTFIELSDSRDAIESTCQWGRVGAVPRVGDADTPRMSRLLERLALDGDSVVFGPIPGGADRV